MTEESNLYEKKQSFNSQLNCLTVIEIRIYSINSLFIFDCEINYAQYAFDQWALTMRNFNFQFQICLSKNLLI